MTEESANRFVSNAKGQWRELVQVARVTPPRLRTQVAGTLAQAAGVGKSTLQRKLEALHMAMNSGLSDEELIERGQRWVMAKFVTDKRNGRQDAQVCLKWLVAPEIRDDAQTLFNRIGQVLNLRTPDERWSYVLSVFADVSDLELWHQAGEAYRAKK